MQCEAERPCFLFLSDNYFPHWKTWVDGREVPMYRADMAFRAIPIDKAGKHRVVMAYRPTYLFLGLIITFFSWLGLAWLALKGRNLPLMPPGSWAVMAKAVAGLKN